LKVVYFDTSALLAWLLGESSASEVKTKIDVAETVVTSVLTLIETERALIRAEMMNVLSAADAEKLRGLLARSKAGWTLMEISEEVRARASRFFPVEPVRTLDAIHLATALTFMRVFPDIELLSYDQRILENARVLGIKTGDRVSGNDG
jgi:predicted nucleic acid-binding protein